MINTIRQIKQGNSKAFKAIFDRYWNIVYRFTGLYLMDNYEKEEITQQVFIKLWEKRELLDEEKDLDGLLFIITRNLIQQFSIPTTINVEVTFHQEEKVWEW